MRIQIRAGAKEPRQVTMVSKGNPHIYFVSDEPRVREAARTTLEQVGFKVACFDSAARFLAELRSKLCGVADADLKTSSGKTPESGSCAKRNNLPLLVFVTSGYNDVAMAIKLLEAGPSDFIKVPLNKEAFLTSIQFALLRTPLGESFVREALTKVELSVLGLVLQGKNNAEIASLLHRSVRTIEAHRSRIWHKLGVRNLLELLEKSALIGLGAPPPKD
jgi:FixJ family two-component response regulator